MKPTTPGPWYIEGNDIKVNPPERAYLGSGAPETVCEMNSSLSPEATAENARMIAEAPLMFKMLKRVLEADTFGANLTHREYVWIDDLIGRVHALDRCPPVNG